MIMQIDQIILLFGVLMDRLPFVSNLIVVLMTTSMTNILSSSATIAVLGPITMNLGSDTLQVGLVTAIASAFGYFTAVATPACTIIYSSGMVKAKDFIKLGLRVGLVSISLLMIFINTYWLIIN